MPEPILISIAAALAGKAATSLYDVVRTKFARNKDALTDLENALEKRDDPEFVEVLAQRLEQAELDDADFKKVLRGEWERFSATQQAGYGSTATQINGDVGKLVQIRDVHGDINL